MMYRTRRSLEALLPMARGRDKTDIRNTHVHLCLVPVSRQSARVTWVQVRRVWHVLHLLQGKLFGACTGSIEATISQPSSAINYCTSESSVSECVRLCGLYYVCNDIWRDIPECDPPHMYIHTYMYFMRIDPQFRASR